MKSLLLGYGLEPERLRLPMDDGLDQLHRFVNVHAGRQGWLRGWALLDVVRVIFTI